MSSRYHGYVQGQKEPSAQCVAWDNGSFTRFVLQPSRVGPQGGNLQKVGLARRGKTPSPHEIIVDSQLLQNFWMKGGAQGVERCGYLFVHLDGEFLTPQAYESHRQAVINEILSTPYDQNDPELICRIQAYLTWSESQRLPADEEQKLLENLPRSLVQWLRALGRRIDTNRYSIGVRLAPQSRRRVIEITARTNPEQIWYLADQEQILRWLRRYDQANGNTEKVKARLESIRKVIEHR